MDQKKEFWIAFGLNFLFPGGGHIYAGETNNGVGLLIAYFIAWILTPVLILPGFIVFGIWVYAMLKSREVVDKYNATVENRKADEEKEMANTVDAEKFIASINKANQLLAADMISDKEFDAKKQAIISELQFKKFSGDQDDLLLGLAPLKKNGIISEDELADIKKALSIL